MKRYFAKIQFRGTLFSGWQIQPNASTVQEEIEQALSKVLRHKTSIVGCGRTDSGVHASDFILHFDAEISDVDILIFKLNRMLSEDIAIQKIVEVKSEAHARFSAVRRSYEYYIHRYKNPFNNDLSLLHPPIFKVDPETLQKTAASFLMYKDFFPFCKTNSDVKTTICDLKTCYWEIDETKMVFHVTADRFLRGMVRLMVGCCFNVAEGKLALDQVLAALERRERLPRDLSVPAHGLFLSKVEYPSSLFV